MEEGKIYDTSAVIELIARRKYRHIDGYITIFTVIEYPLVLNYVEKIIYPSKKDYMLAIKWQIELRRRGNPLPAIDLLIAAIAFNRDMEIVSLNRHFKDIKSIEPSLKLISKI